MINNDRSYDGASGTSGRRVHPLDLSTWLIQIERFRTSVKLSANGEDVERHLRKAFYLGQLTPDLLWDQFGNQMDEELVERALKLRNYGVITSAILGDRHKFNARASDTYFPAVGDKIENEHGRIFNKRIMSMLLCWTEIILDQSPKNLS